MQKRIVQITQIMQSTEINYLVLDKTCYKGRYRLQFRPITFIAFSVKYLKLFLKETVLIFRKYVGFE
jgi:hypothetical protein